MQSPERLLVVDDHELNRALLETRLEAEGYTVETVDCGQKALEKIEGGDFDLVMLDVVMPGMDGLSVLRRLREIHPMTELPIIMSTSKSGGTDIVGALGLGANDYVTKPIDFPVVAARIQTQLALKRANRQVKDTNQSIRETLDRLKLVMDTASIAIFSVDTDGCLIEINQMGLDIFDRGPDELVHAPVVNFFLAEDRPTVLDLLNKVSTEGFFVTNHMARLIDRDGEERTVSLSLRSLYRDAEIIGVVGTAEDVTEWTRHERALKNYIETLTTPDTKLLALLDERHTRARRESKSASRENESFDPVEFEDRRGSVREGPNRRAHRRRRVYKGGKLSFSNDSALMDCVVRNISEGGAKLEFEAYFDCPKFVILRVSEERSYNCQVTWFANKHMGVKFLKER